MRAALAGIALVAAACSGPDLVPVSTPDARAGRWAVSFQQQLPRWTEGRHGYRLSVSCPDGTDLSPPSKSFRVDPLQPLFDRPVYLRFDGPGTAFLAPSDLADIHPDQDTIAVLTLVGLTREGAVAAGEECTGLVAYDGGEPQPLQPGDPFIP